MGMQKSFSLCEIVQYREAKDFTTFAAECISVTVKHKQKRVDFREKDAFFRGGALIYLFLYCCIDAELGSLIFRQMIWQ